MRPGEGDLVRVESEAELRAGLYTYVAQTESAHMGPGWYLILRDRGKRPCDLGGCICKGWDVLPGPLGDFPVSFTHAISRGVVYRLAPDSTSQHSQETRRREVRA